VKRKKEGEEEGGGLLIPTDISSISQPGRPTTEHPCSGALTQILELGPWLKIKWQKNDIAKNMTFFFRF